jgi:uncharacterized protein (TIGR03435 family)
MSLSTKRILVVLSAAASIAAAQQKHESLSLASIKPYEPNAGCFMRPQAEPNGRWSIPCTNVKYLVQRAFGLKDWELSPLPDWAVTSYYSVQALFELTGPMDRATEQAGLQQLLAERVGLKVRREQRQLKVLALIPNSNGAKFKPHGTTERRTPMGGMGNATGTMTIGYLAQVLSTQAGRPVVDQTGLAGEFEIDLAWTPDDFRTGNGPGGSTVPAPPAPAPPPGSDLKGRALRPIDPNGPSLNSALREQLGLRLEDRSEPVSVLVVDSIRRPSAN